MEKNRLEKVQKYVFYKHTNIVTKISEEKISTKNFSKNTRIGYPKNVGKYRLKKLRKHVFYKQINIVTKKWGEKKARKIFFQIHTISQAKNDGKKSSGKSAKTRFI